MLRNNSYKKSFLSSIYYFVFIVGIIISMGVSYSVFLNLRKNFTDNFSNNSEFIKLRLNEKINLFKLHMDSMGKFFLASEFISFTEFKIFSKEFIHSNDYIDFYFWAPLFKESELEKYKKDAQSWMTVYDVKTDNASSSLLMPIYYVYPDQFDYLYGTNIFSNDLIPKMENILDFDLVVYKKLSLKALEHSLVFLLPIKNESNSQQGFIGSSINFDRLLASVGSMGWNIGTCIFTQGDHQQLLYNDNANNQLCDKLMTTNRNSNYVQMTFPLQVGDQNFNVITYEKYPDMIFYEFLMLLAMSVTIVITLTLLIKAMLLRFYERERKAELEQLVEERTQQLKEEKGRAEKALVDLKSTQDQLVESEKMSMLGTLTAGIAHEINNPINFINTSIGPIRRNLNELLKLIHISIKFEQMEDKKNYWVEFAKLKKDIQADFLIDEINELLDNIMDGARRSAAIIRDLRSFSRADEESKTVEDVNEAILSSLTLLKHEYKNKCEMVLDLCESPKTLCNIGKLNQVFTNIIMNAIQASQKNSKIYITTKKEDHFITVSIRDEGHGVPEELHQKIFDPFFTTKERNISTGLGLYITKEIIKNHDGKLELKSEVGHGAEFIISLPLR